VFLRELLIKFGILGHGADSYDKYVQSFWSNPSTILYDNTSEESVWHRYTTNKLLRRNTVEVLKIYVQWLSLVLRRPKPVMTLAEMRELTNFKKSHLFIEFPSVRPNVLTIVERRKLFLIYNISSLARFAAPRLCRRGASAPLVPPLVSPCMCMSIGVDIVQYFRKT
jgi:hypothetical protein